MTNIKRSTTSWVLVQFVLVYNKQLQTNKINHSAQKGKQDYKLFWNLFATLFYHPSSNDVRYRRTTSAIPTVTGLHRTIDTFLWGQCCESSNYFSTFEKLVELVFYLQIIYVF